ncbi:MAG: hypothetical protein F4X77_15865 [Acidobacteriia bacterium]|nr:hypothetical protein [Terriglobia bacterium]
MLRVVKHGYGGSRETIAGDDNDPKSLPVNVMLHSCEIEVIADKARCDYQFVTSLLSRTLNGTASVSKCGLRLSRVHTNPL